MPIENSKQVTAILWGIECNFSHIRPVLTMRASVLLGGVFALVSANA